MALVSEVVGLGSLQRLPAGVERGHCWASFPLLLPFLGRWFACPQELVGASTGDPQSKSAEGAGGGAAVGGRHLNDG